MFAEGRFRAKRSRGQTNVSHLADGPRWISNARIRGKPSKGDSVLYAWVAQEMLSQRWTVQEARGFCRWPMLGP